MTRLAQAMWVLGRQDIVWIDCNPQAGQEMRDIHPFLVLSPRALNDRTSLVIGLPMTTAAYNADNPFAVVAGVARPMIDSITMCAAGREASPVSMFFSSTVPCLRKAYAFKGDFS